MSYDRTYKKQTNRLREITTLYTGLPTKDDTLKTTVRNLYRRFPNIHDSMQL